jgi:anti-anti-sigma factor
MELKIIESTPKASIISLEGHMAVTSVQLIEEDFKKLTVGSGKSCVLDLSGLTFIGSFGVRLFLDVLQSLEKSGNKLVIVNPIPSVKEVFVSTELDTLTGIYATKEEALAAL